MTVEAPKNETSDPDGWRVRDLKCNGGATRETQPFDHDRTNCFERYLYDITSIRSNGPAIHEDDPVGQRIHSSERTVRDMISHCFCRSRQTEQHDRNHSRSQNQNIKIRGNLQNTLSLDAALCISSSLSPKAHLISDNFRMPLIEKGKLDSFHRSEKDVFVLHLQYCLLPLFLECHAVIVKQLDDLHATVKARHAVCPFSASQAAGILHDWLSIVRFVTVRGQIRPLPTHHRPFLCPPASNVYAVSSSSISGHITSVFTTLVSKSSAPGNRRRRQQPEPFRLPRVNAKPRDRLHVLSQGANVFQSLPNQRRVILLRFHQLWLCRLCSQDDNLEGQRCMTPVRILSLV